MIRRRGLTLITGLAILAVSAAPAHALDQQQILSQAGASYYNLPALGFARMQCQVSFNWDTALPKTMPPEIRKSTIDRLNMLQSSASLDAAGVPNFQHEDVGPPPTDQERAGFVRIAGGMDEALGSFFDTWNLFMLFPPLPATSDTFALEESSGGYRLSYQDNGEDIVTTLDKDFAVQVITRRGKTYTEVLAPTLVRMEGKWVPTGYVGDFQPASGPGKTHLVASIDYQTVDGVLIPRLVKLDNLADGRPSMTEITLSACSVSRR